MSYNSIPIMARVMNGPKPGNDLLEGRNLRDLQTAKQSVQFDLDQRVGRAVEIEWIDRTALTDQGEEKAIA